MTIKYLALTALAATALAGCNKDDHTIVAGQGGKPKTEVAKIDPATLPPPIVASKTYRCKDNSLLYIDWLADGGARVRSAPSEAGTSIAATDAAKTLSGDAHGPSVRYNGQSCKA